VLALSVLPQRAGSAQLEDRPEPGRHRQPDAYVLLRALEIGICGTDREIVAGLYGAAPPGEQRLIIGHESLGEVLAAPAGCGLRAGDLAVGIVRRPDPVPCAACARDRWDMCRNGQYTERGIKQRHGYAAQHYRVRPAYLVGVAARLRRSGVLLEPASVVAKAWDQIERIAARADLRMRTALVTGAGPIGLLAALLGRQRGLELHVFDRAGDGPKPELARALGAHYHHGDIARLDLEPDVVLECTGATPLIVDAATRIARDGIVCLTGVSSGGRRIGIDIGAINRELVLENGVIFGSVNAAREHYAAAARALESADAAWLEALISRRVPLGRWQDAFAPDDRDVKVVLDFSGASGGAHAH
jgi:threonine dehydrogenase-like Zn-dependent dehydrogenase